MLPPILALVIFIVSLSSEFIYRENYTIDHTWKIENVAADFFVFYNSFF